MNPRMYSDFTKSLIKEVCAAHFNLAPFLQLVTDLNGRDEILLWLIKNKLVGKRLDEWIINEHKSSQLAAAKDVIGRIQKWKKDSIRVGKDYFPG